MFTAKRADWKLLTVKSNRNDLAHGLKSFAEVGRDFDLGRLEAIMAQVVAFLRSLLESVTTYISTKAYLLQVQQAP